MSFAYTRQGLGKKEARLERFFEIIPGALSFGVLGGLTALSVINPIAAAVFIIVFDFYWLLRLSYVMIFLCLASMRLALEENSDWTGRIEKIDALVRGEKFRGRKPEFRLSRPQDWLLDRIRGGELKELAASGPLPPPSQDIRHLVIIPSARETDEVLEPGIKSLVNGKYPPERMLVVLAVEEKAAPDIRKGLQRLVEMYRDKFLDFLMVVHPAGLPGEARVKGANVTYAAREAAGFLEKKNIPFENVIVSCFDADTVASREYFTCLTYSFMACPGRQRASFQPVPVYHNNIWKVPGFARVLEMGASFFQLTEAARPDKMVTFSSHSMSFKALTEIGYWPVDLVSDDSAIFWKAFLHYEGDYRVIPMYVTLSMDVAEAENWWKTCASVYQQKRRWAWGVENFPIVMRGFLKSKKIPFYRKMRYAYKLLESHLAWATWPFILGVLGWFPAIFAGREFSDSVLYYTAPRITGTIFSLAGWSLFITIILSLAQLPKRRSKHSLFRRVLHAVEWLFIPVIAVFFSGLPALDAQWRLMTGKYMEFWVTEKKR